MAEGLLRKVRVLHFKSVGDFTRLQQLASQVYENHRPLNARSSTAHGQTVSPGPAGERILYPNITHHSISLRYAPGTSLPHPTADCRKCTPDCASAGSPLKRSSFVLDQASYRFLAKQRTHGLESVQRASIHPPRQDTSGTTSGSGAV